MPVAGGEYRRVHALTTPRNPPVQLSPSTVRNAPNMDHGAPLLGSTNTDSDEDGDRAKGDEHGCTSDGDSDCSDSESACSSSDSGYGDDNTSTSTAGTRHGDAGYTIQLPSVSEQQFVARTSTPTNRLLSFGVNADSSAPALTDHFPRTAKTTGETMANTPVSQEEYNLLLCELGRHRHEMARFYAQLPSASPPIETPNPAPALPATSPATPWIAPSLHQPDTLQPQLIPSSFAAQQVAFPYFPQARRLHDHIDKLFETECGRFYESRLSMHFFLRLVYVYSQTRAMPCSTIQQYLYTSIVYQTYPTHFPGSFVDSEPSPRASMGVYHRHVIRSFVLAIPNPYDIMTAAFKTFIEPYDASMESLDVYITRVCTKLHTLTLTYDYVGLLEMFPQSKAAPFVGNDILTRAFPPALQNINHDFTEKQWSTFEGVSEYLLKLKEQPTFKLRATSFHTPLRPVFVAEDANLCRNFLAERCRRNWCKFSHDLTQQRNHPPHTTEVCLPEELIPKQISRYTCSCVITHVYGFTLTDQQVLLEVQRAVDDSPLIDWKMPSKALTQG